LGIPEFCLDRSALGSPADYGARSLDSRCRAVEFPHCVQCRSISFNLDTSPRSLGPAQVKKHPEQYRYRQHE
jgi:hypothetical protein